MKMAAALIALLAFPLTPGPGRATDEIPLPPSSIGYLLMPNADQAIDDLARFAEKLTVPNASLTAFRKYLGVLLESPDLNGVDLKAPLGTVIFNLEKKGEPWAVGFSLKKPESYLKSLAKSFALKSEDARTGVRIYTKEIKVFDRDAYRSANPEEKKDYQRFFKPGEKQICLVVKEKCAWLTRNSNLLPLLTTFTISEIAAPIQANIVLVLEAETFLRLLEEHLNAKWMQPEEKGSSPESLGPESSEKLLQSYLDFYLYYARQVKVGALGITVDDNGISLEKLVQMEEGSGLGELLREQESGKISLARYLHPDAWLIVDGRIRKQEMLLAPFQELFHIAEFLFSQAAGEENEVDLTPAKESYLKSTRAYLGCLGEEFALSLSSSPECLLSTISLTEVKDEAAYRNYLHQDLPKAMEVWKPLSEKMGTLFEFIASEDGEKYKEAEIYTFTIRFHPKRMLEKEGREPEPGKIFERWVKESIVTRIAIQKGLSVSVSSWGGEPEIKPLLDRILAGKSTFDLGWLEDCGEKTNGAIYLSLHRFFGFLYRMATALESSAPREKELDRLKKLAEIDLPFLICFKVEGETVRSRIRIPLEEVRALKELAQVLKIRPQKPKPLTPASGWQEQTAVSLPR